MKTTTISILRNKKTSGDKHLRVSYYIINVVNLLHVHVLAILVAILREVSKKGYIKKFQNQCALCPQAHLPT
jgi:hypothetical protein